MSEALAQSVPELAALIEAERRFQVCGASEELVVEMARLIDRLQLKHGQAIAAVVDELAGLTGRGNPGLPTRATAGRRSGRPPGARRP